MRDALIRVSFRYERSSRRGNCRRATFIVADSATSVVDADLRSHDHDNLYMLGSGVFPTAGTANPTLTIVALALRAAATIATKLAG